MKKIIAIFVIAFGIYSCSDSNSPTNLPEVKIVSELSSPLVSVFRNVKPNEQIQANEVDSIKISSIKVLMSELKLFSQSDDSSSDGRLNKVGPFAYFVDSVNTIRLLATGTVPAGLYDKLKLEFHRFDSNEISSYINNSDLKEFATNDRYSVIVKGVKYKSGIATHFAYYATTTVNLMFKFAPAIDLTESSTTTFAIQLDPNIMFTKNSSLLDPTNSSNVSAIENNIKNMLKLIKK
jgi:hypothetical protein